MGHNYIGTEHILLALLDTDDEVGVLHRLGVDKARAERDITAALRRSRVRKPGKSR